MEIDNGVNKKEKVARRPLPRLAKVLIVTEFVLSYIMASQFYILEQVAYVELHELKEAVTQELDKKRAMGAILSIFPAWLADGYAGRYWVFSTAYVTSCFWPVCLLAIIYDGVTFRMKQLAFEVASYFTLIYYAVEGVRFVILSEQLDLPDQEENLPTYLSLLFLARSLANTLVTTLLAYRGQERSFLFGHTAMLVGFFIAYIFFFMFVKKHLKSESPLHFTYSRGVFCLLSAIKNRLNSCFKKRTSGKHLVQYASSRHDILFVYNGHVFLRILVFAGLSVFVGITEFFFRNVTVEEIKKLVPMEFLPTNYDLLNLGHPAGIFWFFLWNILLQTMFHHFKIRWSVTQLYGLGFILAGLALMASFIVEFSLEKTGTVLPDKGFGQMRIFNAQKRVVAVKSRATSNESLDWVLIPPQGLWTVGRLNVVGKKEEPMTLKFYDSEKNKMRERHERLITLELESVSYVITDDDLIHVHGFDPLARGPPGTNNPREPRVYVLCGLPFCFGELVFDNSVMAISENVPDTNENSTLFTLPIGVYNVTSNYGEYSNSILRDIRIEIGGVYAILIYPLTHTIRGAAFFTVVKPSQLSTAVVIPQIMVFRFGYLFTRIYGFLFFYTQSPPKLRCTFWNFGPFAYGLSNVILYIDRRYWHPITDIYQIATFLVIHFAAVCLYVFYSFRFEYQTWSHEGAVFQGYPPLATRYLARERKIMSIMNKKKMSRATSLEETMGSTSHQDESE